MKIQSPIIAAGSGSIAGVTMSRNRGGLYMRARAVPTNPNTTQQQAVRSALSSLVGAWTNALTPAQRAAWTVYADNTPVTDSLGASIFLTGQQMYIRGNTARLQLGVPRADDGPTVYDLGSFTTPVLGAASASANTISMAYTATDDWANEDDAIMGIYTSRPQNQSVNYFKGPYQQAFFVSGDATTPPTSPVTIPTAFPFAVDQKVFVKVNVSRADGRYSGPFRGFVIGT